MSKGTTKIAVVGAGHLGRIHARLLPQIRGAKLAAVADPSPAAHKLILKEHNVPVFSDYTKLLEADVDAVIIATPTVTHFDIAKQFLENSVHCLIEKPMTACPEHAQVLADLAKENDCVLSVGHVEQFNPAIEFAKRAVGTPKFFQASRCSGYTFRSTDIGVVHDLMIHDIELVNSMVPGNLKDCCANGVSVFGKDEDIAQARLEFDCGAVANLTASRCSFVPERSFMVFGTDGFASVDLANHTVQSVSVPGWLKQRAVEFETLTPEQKAFVSAELFQEVLHKTTTITPTANAILEEQKDWLKAITTGRSPRNSAENALEAVQIAGAVIEAINAHRWDSTGNATGALFNLPATDNDPIPVELSRDGLQSLPKKAA